MQKLAVFDIDGTIFRGSLTISLVERLIRDEVFPIEARTHYVQNRKKWIEREGDYDAYINSLVKAFMLNIKGAKYEDVLRAAEAVVREEKGFVYKYTRDLAESLRKKGFFMLAVSHSPKTIVDIFGKSIGFSKTYGMLYEIGSTDRFTGEIMDLHLIGNKANIVKRVIEKEGLSLKGSVGVGDTESDIGFLELVEKPICFNPNKKLYQHARRMKWTTIVERKDVVYTL